MKKNVHPEYRPVVFRDRCAELLLLTRSTLSATLTGTVELGGRTCPVVDVSSASHPFWTDRGRVLDPEERVERFRRRDGGVS